MPLVLVTGAIDWFNRYNGNITQIFRIKMICGGIVTLLSFIIALWWILDPEIYLGSRLRTGLFIFVNMIDLAAAVVAGFYGGKLVFKA